MRDIQITVYFGFIASVEAKVANSQLIMIGLMFFIGCVDVE